MLLVILQVLPSVPVSGLSPPLSSPSVGSVIVTGQMVFVGCLIAVWGFSVHVRCSDARIRHYLMTVSALCVGWILVVIMKYASSHDVLESYLWYLFYVPLLFIPTFCLFSAMRASFPARSGILRVIRRIVVVVDLLLIAFVLANNAHHNVFVFSFDDLAWSRTYSYAWGYWVIFAWCASQFLAFIATLFVAAHRRLRNAFVPLAVIMSMGIAYALLYALRVEKVMIGNFTLNFTIIVTIALEVCLDFGLLPSYIHYGKAFEALPFDLKILTDDFEVAFSTDCALPLAPAVRGRLESDEASGTSPMTFRVEEEPNVLFKSFPVAGGVAVLATDVSGIIERRGQLERRQDALRRRNDMLEKNRDVQSRLYRQRAEGDFFDELEHSLKKTTARIEDILQSLPSGSDQRSVEQRRAKLMMVKLLVAYCKRKGSLVFDQKQSSEFDHERLQLIVNEMICDLRCVGVDCAAIVEVDGALPAKTASVLYDCLYDFALEAFSHDDPALMIYLHDVDARRVELSVVMEKANRGEANQIGRLAELRETLEERDVMFRLEDEEDRLNLIVIASRGEAE